MPILLWAAHIFKHVIATTRLTKSWIFEHIAEMITIRIVVSDNIGDIARILVWGR